MSDSHFKIPSAQIVFTVLAVAIAVAAFFVAYQNNRHVKLETGEEITETDAESILARANDAVNFADEVLSFLEGMSVVVGAGVAVGAWMIRNTLQRQAEAISQFVEDTQQQFTELVTHTEEQFQQREAYLKQIEANFTQRLEEMIVQTRQDIADVQEQARKSFRVISLLVLAEQQKRAHNVDAALNMLEDAYELDPDNQAANYLLGYLLTFRREFDRAIKHLERALELEPGFPPAIAALGLALRRKGDGLNDPEDQAERDQFWGEAERKLLEALSKDPKLTDEEGESYYGSLGGLYRRQERYNAALDAYERAHQFKPDSSYPLINLAMLHKHQGNEKLAERYFEEVIKAAELQLDDDPRDQWTRADFAQAHLALGRPDEALNHINTVIEQGAKHGLLETIHDGLRFLRKAPAPIDGLERVITRLEDTLGRLEE